MGLSDWCSSVAGPTVDAFKQDVWDVVYSPCDLWTLSKSVAQIQLWDLQFPDCTRTVSIHEEKMENYVCAAFSPMVTTEPCMAVADYWTCRLDLYKLQTSAIMKGILLRNHVKPLSLAFLVNGQQLAIGTEHGFIELWSHQAEEEPSVSLQRRSDWVNCVAYSSCDQWIASDCNDNPIRIWRRQQQHRQQPIENADAEAASWYCAAVVHGFFMRARNISWNPNGPPEFVLKSRDNAVPIQQIPVDLESGSGNGEEHVTVHLVLGSNLGRLCTENLSFEGATGLGPMYEKLLVQRGAAVGESLGLRRDNGESSE